MIHLIISYLIIILVLTLFKRTHLNGKWIYLFRAFFPSWRFFEDSGPVPVLYYRIKNTSSNESPWEEGLPKSKRGIISILINPYGNLLLAYQSMLQHLIADIDKYNSEGQFPFEAIPSYQLVKSYSEYKAKENAGDIQFEYQFKISITKDPSTKHELEDLIISPFYEA